MLEGGRARALSSALARDRADLDQLRRDSRVIFEEYAQAVARMREVEALERMGGTGGAVLREQVRAARASYARTVADVRTVPGYEMFQSAPTWADVASWMSDIGSPVVYLLATRAGGLALLVTTEPGSAAAVEAVWLDELSGAAVRDIVAAGDQAWSASLRRLVGRPRPSRLPPPVVRRDRHHNP